MDAPSASLVGTSSRRPRTLALSCCVASEDADIMTAVGPARTARTVDECGSSADADATSAIPQSLQNIISEGVHH